VRENAVNFGRLFRIPRAHQASLTDERAIAVDRGSRVPRWIREGLRYDRARSVVVCVAETVSLIQGSAISAPRPATQAAYYVDRISCTNGLQRGGCSLSTTFLN
jgi:hypothetical protein